MQPQDRRHDHLRVPVQRVDVAARRVEAALCLNNLSVVTSWSVGTASHIFRRAARRAAEARARAQLGRAPPPDCRISAAKTFDAGHSRYPSIYQAPRRRRRRRARAQNSKERRLW